MKTRVWLLMASIAASGCSVLYPFDFTTSVSDASVDVATDMVALDERVDAPIEVVAKPDIPEENDVLVTIDGFVAVDVLVAADVPQNEEVSLNADAPLSADVSDVTDVPLAHDVSTCMAPQVRCGASCVNTNNDREHCGTCNVPCAMQVNSVASCSSGVCNYECTAGFDRCGGRACTVNLRSDPMHCGRCNNVCSFANATAHCNSGSCALGLCHTHFANCNTDAADGCETDLRISNLHCGRCGAACLAGSSCVAGSCVAGCMAPSTMCGVNCTNTSLDPANCGTCGNRCPARPNATSVCRSGTCALQCNATFGDCDRDITNGCETQLTSSVMHCGRCDARCNSAPANAVPVCRSGMCTYDCMSGFADCDGNAANGCEVRLDSVEHCGMCGRRCMFANATASCRDGACHLGTCMPGFDNCDGVPGNGCEARIDTVNHCGACNRSCGTRAGATTSCSSGACVYTCMAGFGDCDGNATNGCETNTNDNPGHCGSCGAMCPGTTCSLGRCVCGTYDQRCCVERRMDKAFTFCHGDLTCVGGIRCTCAMGETFCNGNCVSLANDPNHCGACGRTCPLGWRCQRGTCE